MKSEMKKISTSILLVFSMFMAIGQTDPAAKAALDKVSETTKSYTNIALDFSVSLENKKANIPSTTMSGNIVISGDKYHLKLEGNEQISDGERIWRILADDKVVETMAVDEMEEEGLTPNRLLTMYERGFKYRMGEKMPFRNKEVQLILLYPEDPSAVPYGSIELAIDPNKNQIVYLKELGKDGTETTYEISTFRSDLDLKEDSFTFNENNYPGFEVIDVGF